MAKLFLIFSSSPVSKVYPTQSRPVGPSLQHGPERLSRTPSPMGPATIKKQLLNVGVNLVCILQILISVSEEAKEYIILKEKDFRP